MNDKSERVHALVDAGPWPGMSEAFDAHMGAACWTDPAYAPDASTWAAAWKAGAAAGGAQAVDKANSYIVDNARLAEEVERLAKQRDGYRHEMTVQMEAVASMVDVLQRLADAADTLGVNHFGDDWLSDEVQELQAATRAARLALGA